jgi:hypothetical protein
MKTAQLFLSPLCRAKSRKDDTLLTVCFSLRTFSLRAILLLAPAFFSCANLHAQVTIGGTEVPKAGTILDLNSTVKGGLILSNVTIADPELIPYDAGAFPGITTAADADVNPGLRGAMVYNDGQNAAVPAGIYVWNGNCWTKDGSDITATVLSITANGSTNTSLSFINTGSVTFAVVSPQADVSYQWFVNTSSSTTDGTLVDTGNSYTTPTLTERTYYYYCTATPASCPSSKTISDVISVTVIPDPLSLPVGNGAFSGKTCFDVVQTNDNPECGFLDDRESKKHSFSKTPTETYTFIPTDSPSGLMFAYKNLDPLHPVIKSISQNEYEVTVTFYPGMDGDAKGLNRAGALKADLYAVFTSGTTQQQLTLTLSVSDCQCCPGLFIPDGEYGDIGPITETFLPGSTAQNGDGRAANALLTSANGFANKKTGNGLCYYYRDANLDGIGGGSSTYSWHNAGGSASAIYPYNNGGVCQTAEGIDVDDAHAYWRLPNLGELAQIGQAVSSNATGTINDGIGSQAEINKAIGKTSPNYHQYGSLPAGTITTVGTYNLLTIWYWSSTQYNAANYWMWNYVSGYRAASAGGPASIYRVRCVRRF